MPLATGSPPLASQTRFRRYRLAGRTARRAGFSAVRRSACRNNAAPAAKRAERLMCGFRRSRPGIPSIFRAPFQSDGAHQSNLMAPGMVSSRSPSSAATAKVSFLQPAVSATRLSVLRTSPFPTTASPRRFPRRPGDAQRLAAACAPSNCAAPRSPARPPLVLKPIRYSSRRMWIGYGIGVAAASFNRQAGETEHIPRLRRPSISRQRRGPGAPPTPSAARHNRPRPHPTRGTIGPSLMPVHRSNSLFGGVTSECVNGPERFPASRSGQLVDAFWTSRHSPSTTISGVMPVERPSRWLGP